MTLLASLAGDVHHACRMVVRSPGQSAVVIVSLAVGIGVNTAVFSWIQHRLIQPLPGVSRSASLHFVEPRTETGGYPSASWLEYQDLRERLRSFEDLFAARMLPLYVGEAGRVERLYGMLVSNNYFSALGVQPAIGRFLEADGNGTSGSGEHVAIISHGLWQSRFGGAPDVLGRVLRVNGQELPIAGVTPRAFQGTVLGLSFDVWLPAAVAPVLLNGSRELEQRSVRAYAMLGRLRPSVTSAQAQAELDASMAWLARAYPDTNATIRGEVLRFWRSPRGPQRMMAYALATLQGLMLLLLVAVCGNSANLVLARASARQKEMAVRLALGAARWRIASLLVAENVVLALLAAALAVPIAIWCAQAFRILPVSGLPIRFETSVGALPIAVAALLGIVSGVLVGAAPALQLARLDPQPAFRAGSRTAHRSRLRSALMGVQVALAVVVLLAAGLFVQSFRETRTTYPGFRSEGVLLASYDLAGRNAGAEYIRTFPARLLDRVRHLPGVEAAAIASSVPLDIHGLPSRVFAVEGWTRTEPGVDRALVNTVTPGYFEAMAIPLRAGADFAALADASAPPQAIVNDAFVRRYLSGLEPLGRRLQARGRTHVITAVAADTLYDAFGEPPTPVIYFSYRDNPASFGDVHVRTRPGAEPALVPHLRGLVRELDAELPLFNARTLGEHVEANLIFRRIPARLFSVLAPMLLLLAAIGIYAVVSYTVSLRTTEIGVRLALGATPRRVVATCMGQSLTVIVCGALAGWVVAALVAIDLAPGGAIDATVFALVPALLLSVAAFACWLPARRATRIDPMTALRQDG